MADIFNKESIKIKQPITADKCTIHWDGQLVTTATNISISYSQPVSRRHTIGNNDAVIFAGQPQGQITLQRLYTVDAQSLFGTASWDGCKSGKIFLTLASHCDGKAGKPTVFNATGCVVTQWSISAESEGLTVIDSVVVEFLQLTAQ